jgi:hypothetical protein
MMIALCLSTISRSSGSVTQFQVSFEGLLAENRDKPAIVARLSFVQQSGWFDMHSSRVNAPEKTIANDWIIL